ncbi:MAG: 2-oxoacid:acceptor oxidoreductase family protein, partial [Dehalococcoidia bacterium]
GAITAAKILAQAAHLDGYRGVTAAPTFGAERRGAPVSASTRIARAPVHVMSQVEQPDAVVILDHTLLKYDDVTGGLREGGWVIVNSFREPGDLDIKGSFNVATADATRVCRELGLAVAGQTIVNTAILGAFVRATGVVDIASVERAIRDRFRDSAADVNLSAIARTHEITKLRRAA